MIAVVDDRKLAPEERRLLREFAQDTLHLLQSDNSPLGQLLARHIGRQMDLLDTERYVRWFDEMGESAGFDREVTQAAIAASDVTKAAHSSPIARANFGTTTEHVAALAARGELLFGRAFDPFTPLEDLYMHAEGGRRYALEELTRRGNPRLGALVAEAVVGHDSFNSGFGQRRLKPLLARKHAEDVSAFDYPVSRSPAGFLVQTLDRLDGCELETMVRYVSEAVTLRHEPITAAIRGGVHENHTSLRDAFGQLGSDAHAVLTAQQARVFLESVALADFATALTRFGVILSCLGDPPTPDGFYQLRTADGCIMLDSLEVFREHFPSIVVS